MPEHITTLSVSVLTKARLSLSLPLLSSSPSSHSVKVGIDWPKLVCSNEHLLTSFKLAHYDDDGAPNGAEGASTPLFKVVVKLV